MTVISINAYTTITGFFVPGGTRCVKHWDKRRNPNYYQPACRIDMQNEPCSRCVKEAEKAK